MSVPALGVVYHGGSKSTVVVIMENAEGTNNTYYFYVENGGEVYIEDDVIHIPALPYTPLPVTPTASHLALGYTLSLIVQALRDKVASVLRVSVNGL